MTDTCSPPPQEVSVVVPAHNEEQAIAQVITGLTLALKASGWKFEIIVVDDGSADRTADVARAAGVTVIAHPKNAGYGGALRTGIEHASYGWIATIDADCSYPPAEIVKLLPYAATFDMVIGARQGRHYWGNLFKYPARILFLALAQFAVGEKIPDVNSGLRLFKKSIALSMLPRLCRGFSFSTTLTLSFMSSHCFVKFVPIEYSARVGTSKVRYVRDTLRTLQLLLETIVYYNPIKASLLLVLFPLAGSLICLGMGVIQQQPVLLFFSVTLFCWSLLLMGLGFILFMIAQVTPARRE